MPPDERNERNGNGSGLLNKIWIRAETIASGMTDLIRRLETIERDARERETRVRQVEIVLADKSLFSRLDAVEKRAGELTDEIEEQRRDRRNLVMNAVSWLIALIAVAVAYLKT